MGALPPLPLPLRTAALRVLLRFADARVADPSKERRLAAVDAIGNLLVQRPSAGLDESRDSYAHSHEENVRLLLRTSSSKESVAVENIMDTIALDALHDRCIWTIIDNLKGSISYFSQMKGAYPLGCVDSLSFN